MSITRGIVLAGGSGSRLYPLTQVASKQLLPVHDKPMIYYPLATLMVAGVREILLVSTPEDTPRYRALLGDGARWGISLEYAVQECPNGIAAALPLAEQFIAGDPVCVILGDNIFYGKLGLDRALASFEEGACAFAFPVVDPERYAVVEFADDGTVASLEEKPAAPKSHDAVPGLYLYDATAVERARTLSPSVRGELEITDLNRSYLEDGALVIERVGRGGTWLDTGTPDSLLEASQFIASVERRQGLRIACLEEVAWRNGFIDRAQLGRVIAAMPSSPYRSYLEDLEAGKLE